METNQTVKLLKFTEFTARATKTKQGILAIFLKPHKKTITIYFFHNNIQKNRPNIFKTTNKKVFLQQQQQLNISTATTNNKKSHFKSSLQLQARTLLVLCCLYRH